MYVRWKRPALVFGVVVVALVLLFLPGFSWSKLARHTLKRTIVKAEKTLARWRGHEPRLIAIAGTLNAPGVQVQALDSHSGWAALADGAGSFVLPDLLWYPGANYELVISQDESTGRLIKITAPKTFPETGVFDAGEWNDDQGNRVEISSLIGLTSITWEDPDRASAGYFKELFENITSDQHSDDGKITALRDYVFSKRTDEERQSYMGSPREMLEKGSGYCGHLSAAMKALVVAGGYTARAVNISDGMTPPGTHVVLEVYYGGAWHLYDPTYGVAFLNKHGQIASYKDLRLETSLVSEALFQSVRRKIRHRVVEQLKGMYATGYHHIYQLVD